MPIPETLNDRDHRKYREDPNNSNQTVVAVADFSGLSIPLHDYIAVTYPTTSSEVYTFKTGGSGGTTVATVTVTYTDDTKENLTSVERL